MMDKKIYVMFDDDERIIGIFNSKKAILDNYCQRLLENGASTGDEEDFLDDFLNALGLKEKEKENFWRGAVDYVYELSIFLYGRDIFHQWEYEGILKEFPLNQYDPTGMFTAE